MTGPELLRDGDDLRLVLAHARGEVDIKPRFRRIGHWGDPVVQQAWEKFTFVTGGAAELQPLCGDNQLPPPTEIDVRNIADKLFG